MPASPGFKAKDLISWGWGAVAIAFIIPFFVQPVPPVLGLVMLTGICLLVAGYTRKRTQSQEKER